MGPVTAPAFSVWITLSTPAGSPASVSTWANRREVSGVRAAGFNTMVHPAAIAGAILRVAMASGKFHGVMNRLGPTGRFMTSKRVLPSGAIAKRPLMRAASSENQRRNSAPYATSPLDSARGLPISNVISSAKSSARAVTASNARRRISARSRGAVAAQPGCAATAASSAAIPSAGVALEMRSNTFPVEGSSTASVDESLEVRQCPPMKSPVSSEARRRRSSSGVGQVDAMLTGLPSGFGRCRQQSALPGCWR